MPSRALSLWTLGLARAPDVVGGHGARRLIAYQRPDRKICYVRLPACVQKPSPAAAVPFKLARQRAPRRERAARRQAPVSEHVSRRRPFSLNPSGGTSATRADVARDSPARRRVPVLAAYEPRLSSQNVVYRWCAITSKLSGTGRGLRDGEGLPRFVEEEFGRSCAAASWPAGLPVFAVTTVALTGWCRSHAKGGRSARAAALRPAQAVPSQVEDGGAGWRNAPRTWWTLCFPRCLYGSGC